MDGKDFLQIQAFTVFLLLFEAGMGCSAVHLLGCCLQSTGSIHINVALLQTVIYAIFCTPETCTRVCKDIKCHQNPAADYCLTKSAFEPKRHIKVWTAVVHQTGAIHASVGCRMRTWGQQKGCAFSRGGPRRFELLVKPNTTLLLGSKLLFVQICRR